MKSKFFTLLTLLLCLCSSGAWADDLTVTFAYDNINATGTATASVDEVIGASSVAIVGSYQSFNGTNNGGTYNDVAVPKYARISVSNDGTTSTSDYVRFTITPEPGVTFTPTSVSLGAIREGTDGGTMYVYANRTQLTETTLEKNTVVPGRNQTGKDKNEVSYLRDGYTFSYGITSTTATAASPLYIDVCMSGLKNKSWGMWNVVISGTYTKVDITTYTLTTTADPVAGGTISRSPNVAKFEAGTAVTLTATPNYGYEFVNWTKGEDVVSTNAEYAITTAAADETYVAHFNALTTYDVTASASPDEGGTIVKSPNHDSYVAGDDFTVTATPNTGYKFVNWTVNGVDAGTTNPLAINDIDAAKTIVANFEQLKSITFNKGTAEGTAPATEYVDVDTEYTLPVAFYMYKTGYTLTAWNDGENDHAVGSKMTITEDVTLTPIYTENTVELGDAAATVNWTFARNAGAPTLNCEGAEMDYVQRTTINETPIDAVMHIDTRSGKVISGYNSNGKLNNTNNAGYAQVNKGTKFSIPVFEGATITYTTTNGTPTVSDVTFGGETGTLSTKVFTYVYHGAKGTLDIIEQTGNFYPSGISVSYPKYIPGPADPVAVGGDAITWDFSSTDAQAAAGTVTADSRNTLTATDGSSTIIYVAGSSDSYDPNGYLKPNGKTSNGNKRYFILHISSNGKLALTTKSNNGKFDLKKSANDTNDWDGTTDLTTITTVSDGVAVESSITYDADKPYIYIGFTENKRYIQKITWTPISDEITLTIDPDMDGWRTFYDGTKDYQVDEDTKIYVVKEKNGTPGVVTLSEIEGKKVKATIPVILKNTSNTITLTETTDAEAPATNLLAVTDGGAANGYRLGYGGDGVCFYRYNVASTAAGIVYIPLAHVTTGDASRPLTFVFDDDELTGIKNVESVKLSAEGEYFDLSGRRVVQPTKGLYIVNGKKVIIK